ncbi:oxidoreductase [Streptomyces sp. AS58]|uniref:CBS domain-containing protein n=1 Tax=Streptomyces sp. AS58 TaxID=1519489 RepID=UPI0006AE69CA|nr:CBS domain-containing protein [Streptomyces sp. AS58]KOV66650.1 oxidoreductase [Streptomyces sp. AS58]
MTADYVREVMTPGVVAVRPDASVAEAARLMRAQDVGDVVVADGEQVVGVLTDRDIAVRAVAKGLDPSGVSARSVCTPDPVVVSPQDPVSTAVALMREKAVRRLPVVEDGLPVGVVSLGDLALALDPDSALADISRAAPGENATAPGRRGPARAG